ncbi:MAG: hypothetical protein GF393_04845 [Armatimonadia bacterium]|nr:hypothetical protein [Armatimonadia bacterium]
MSDDRSTNVEVEPRPDPLDCGCNAERERRVAQFLVARLRDVDGITRIYSHRAGGRIDFNVEVDDFWEEGPRHAAYDAFRDIRRRTWADDTDFRVFQKDTMPGPDTSSTVWFGA